MRKELNIIFVAQKIKDNLPDKNDAKHDNLVDDAMKVINKKSKLADPLVLACKFLSDGVKDNDFYSKHLDKKLDDKFADNLCKIQKDHLNNPDVIKESNTLLDELAAKNPKIKQCIANNGGLAKPIGEFEPSEHNRKCKKALEDFHDNLSKNFDDQNVKNDLLTNEKDTTNEIYKNLNNIYIITNRDVLKDWIQYMESILSNIISCNSNCENELARIYIYSFLII